MNLHINSPELPLLLLRLEEDDLPVALDKKYDPLVVRAGLDIDETRNVVKVTVDCNNGPAAQEQIDFVREFLMSYNLPAVEISSFQPAVVGTELRTQEL
jgi:hypothetical protein